MSLFSSKTKGYEPKNVSIKTGRYIDDMVMTLIEGAHDRDETVKNEIEDSLYEIGLHETDLVLSSCAAFLERNQKLDRDHRVILLSVIERILELKRDSISEELGHNLIYCCLKEMVFENEVIPTWQGAANRCLVVLGRRFCDKVIESLMDEFKSGTVPHYFVMKTLGDLSGANPLDVLPHLRNVLARTIPALGAIRHDNLRWAFASSLARFAEAIISHAHNFEDPKERKEELNSYSAEMFSGFEYIFTNWGKSSNRNVRLATMQAVGHMCSILKREIFDVHVPKVVPALLEMYRKESVDDHLPITQSLCSVLSVACEDDNTVLAPFLNNILADLHVLTCRPVNYDNQSSVKNHYELLRCYEIVARRFNDETVNYLMRALDSKKSDPHSRDGTITIIKHLVTRLETELSSKKELFISGLQPLALNETSYLVRKALAQLIITLASKGYLHIEGGEVFLDFIIRNCSITDEEIEKFEKENRNSKAISPRELRSVCENVLNLMTTTIPSSHQILWPYILEPITHPKFSYAVSSICKCAAFVGKIKREQFIEEYLIDFDRMIYLPKPQVILARLLVLLSLPMRGRQIGNNILDCLLQISGIIHPSIIEKWDATIPKILAYFESNQDDWKQNTWEDLVMRLLTETIKVISDDEWTMKLGDALLDHLDMVKKDSDLRRVNFKLLGVVIGSVSHKDFIKNRLAAMWENVNHDDELQRLGVAQAFGYTAANHLDIVLEKLAIFVSPSEKKEKESGGFFSRMFSSKDSGPKFGPHSPTLSLSYGYVCQYARPQIITSRIDGQILNNIKPFLKTQNNLLKENVIKAIELIGRAVHPNKLQMKYELKMRDELLESVINFLTPTKKGPPVTNKLRQLALGAMTTLIKLDPIINDELEEKILETTVKFLNLELESDEAQILFDNFNEMLSQIIEKDTSVLRLRGLIKQIKPYISNDEEEKRTRALRTSIYLLKKFIEYLLEKEERRDSKFDQIGETLSIFLPRSTDTEAQNRQMSLEATQLLLYIDHLLKIRMESPNASTAPPSTLTPITALRKQIITPELNDQLSILIELSSILAETVSIGEIGRLLSSLVKEINDKHGTAARGICVILYGLVSQRSKDLDTEVAQLVNEICSQLDKIGNDSTINGTLNALKQLAITHTTMVLDQLLDRPLPHPEYMKKAFQILARDKKLSSKVFFHLMNTLNNTELFETIIVDKQKKTTKLEPKHRSLSATSALKEIFEKPDVKDFVIAMYSRLYPTLILRIGSSQGFKEAVAEAVEAFRAFVTCTEDVVLENILDNDDLWTKLRSSDYLEVIPIIAGHICKTRPETMEQVYTFLLPYLKGAYTGQRLVSVTTLGEFVNHCSQNDDLLAKVIDSILNSMESKDLKIQALAGLSNIVSTSNEQQDTYATTILDALMSGLEDKDEDISLSALNGLKKVMSTVEDNRVAPIIITLFRRLTPLLDRPLAKIREAAAELISALSRFGNGSAKSQFTENCHKILPTILFHINDEDPDVQLACKRTMVAISPYLRDEEIEKLFTGSSFNPERSLNYDEFQLYVSKLLINAFPERLNYYVMEAVDKYFKSEWNVIKASAASFVGNILGNIPVESRESMNLNPGRVSKALISLMAQPSAMVRRKAASAIKMLHSY